MTEGSGSVVGNSIGWRLAWSYSPFRKALLSGLIGFTVIGVLIATFFGWIDRRAGHMLHDPLLEVFGPWNVSNWTFAVLYGTLIIIIASVLPRPMDLVRGIHAYVLLMLLRMSCMALFTLEPPVDIIPLIDPVTRAFYPGTTPFLKDLFFSGHTATLALMVPLAHGRGLGLLALCATFLIGVLVLAQHVHWTVDVLVAPVAAWAAWRLSAVSLRLCGLPIVRNGEAA